MLDRTGRKQVSVIIPLLEGRWYLHSMVPDRVLRARYTETAAGIMTIIVVSCCLFALFLSRQRSMAARTQKMLMDLAYRDSLTGLRNFDGFKPVSYTHLVCRRCACCGFPMGFPNQLCVVFRNPYPGAVLPGNLTAAGRQLLLYL